MTLRYNVVMCAIRNCLWNIHLHKPDVIEVHTLCLVQTAEKNSVTCETPRNGPCSGFPGGGLLVNNRLTGHLVFLCMFTFILHLALELNYQRISYEEGRMFWFKINRIELKLLRNSSTFQEIHLEYQEVVIQAFFQW